MQLKRAEILKCRDYSEKHALPELQKTSFGRTKTIVSHHIFLAAASRKGPVGLPRARRCLLASTPLSCNGGPVVSSGGPYGKTEKSAVKHKHV